MFLNPLLLGGVALIAVPIVLHLIMRQRPRHVEFPALRFVRKAQEQNRRTYQLRHWLLLFLRMAVIALLAFALARPTIQASGWLANRTAPVDAVLLFDTAAHMGYRHENRTRLDAAREISGWLLEQLPEESRVSVVDGESTEAVFQVDLSAASQRIERLRTIGASRTLVEQIGLGLDLLEKSEHRPEVYVFTDLAAASWTIESGAAAEALRGRLAKVGLYLIDVSVAEPQNYGLGELRLSGQVLARNATLSLSTDVQAVGRDGTKTVEVSLIGEAGKREKRATETIDVKAGQSAPVQIMLGALDPGTRQGVVEILGRDGLAEDNQRYFTVEVRPAWKVLIVAPEPAERQAVYVSEAIAPEAYRRSNQARFDCTIVGFDKLDTMPLDTFAAVIVLDPASLIDPTWSRLSTYALGGGGVLLCLGDQAAVEPFNGKAAQELLPARLENIARFPEGNLHVATDPGPHPVWSKFRPLAGEVPWEAFPVFRYWRLGGLQPGCSVIARYSNQNAAIVEKPLGQGRVLLVNTPLSERPNLRDDERWNALPTGIEPWPFVMLINEMTIYLVGGAAEQLNYTVGQTAILKLDPQQRTSTYLLRLPEGDPLPRNVPPQQNAIVESMTTLAGNYQVESGAAVGGLRRGYSANLPLSATQLNRIDTDTLDKLLGKETYRLARDIEQVERSVATGRTGQELFPLLITLVAVILGCEHVLANRFYREA
jgi:hypothetical protein